MRKTNIIILLGLLVIIIPFLGFPGFWKNIFLVIIGLAIIVTISILKRKHQNSFNSSMCKEEEQMIKKGVEESFSDNSNEEIFNQSIPKEEVFNPVQEEKKTEKLAEETENKDRENNLQ